MFQHPISLGADLCIYSATKYLAGFSDMLGGVAIGRDRDLIDKLRSTRALLGNILQPDECWLLDSRLATVSLRMNKQSKNASRIVAELAKHEMIERIHYPASLVDPEQRRIYEDEAANSPEAKAIASIRGLKKMQMRQQVLSKGGDELAAQMVEVLEQIIQGRIAEFTQAQAGRSQREASTLAQDARQGRRQPEPRSSELPSEAGGVPPDALAEGNGRAAANLLDQRARNIGGG